MSKVTKVFNELLNTSSQSAVKMTSFFTIHLAPTRKDIEEIIAPPFECVTMPDYVRSELISRLKCAESSSTKIEKQLFCN